MFFDVFLRPNSARTASHKRLTLLVFLACCLLIQGFSTQAQAQNQDTSQQPPANPNKQEAPPEAGGPAK